MVRTHMDSPDCSNNEGAFASISRKCSRIRANPATNGSLSGFSSDKRSNGFKIVVVVVVVVDAITAAVAATVFDVIAVSVPL